MNNKQRVLLVISIFVISTLLISACTQSLSSVPAATPTVIATGLFVAPIASVENPMALIEQFAKETAAAQTTVANGGTPVTPQAITTGAVISSPTSAPTSGTPTNVVAGTPTNVVAGTTTPVIITPSGPSVTPITPGVNPKDYVLHAGEFPYCIARRFNVNPDALLSASGLTSPDVYLPNQKLIIPQSGAFPGNPMLATHPTTYTVLSGDETVYSIACKFGNVYPDAIVQANTKDSISLSSKLTTGQKLQIP